jgi:hypothetical protein
MATNFLEATGGSTTGYFSAVTTVMSSEIVSLGSSLTATSASIFTSSASFGQAIWADVLVHWGGTIAPTAGGFISGWFLRSPDGGTTFETVPSSAVGLARPADFIIPLSTISYASSNVAYGSGIVKMPWSPFKVQLQNSAGATFPSSASAYTLIQLGPVAVQY